MLMSLLLKQNVYSCKQGEITRNKALEPSMCAASKDTRPHWTSVHTIGNGVGTYSSRQQENRHLTVPNRETWLG